MTAVEVSGLRAMVESGKKHGPVDLNICLVYQAFAAQTRLYNQPNRRSAFDSQFSIICRSLHHRR